MLKNIMKCVKVPIVHCVHSRLSGSEGNCTISSFIKTGSIGNVDSLVSKNTRVMKVTQFRGPIPAGGGGGNIKVVPINPGKRQ
jgi:hypothetical protein